MTANQAPSFDPWRLEQGLPGWIVLLFCLTISVALWAVMLCPILLVLGMV